MLFSRDWLSVYVDLPETPEAIARRLTFAGFSVEGMTERDGEPADTVFDVDVTTNRPDAMNHAGLARELSVLYGRALRLPVPAISESPEGSETAAAAATVEILDADGCSRFVGRVVRGVKVGDSPEWLKRRLESIGKRPINNVVDVTNFVLWELGQPLHAYDLAQLQGAKLLVRRAREGERLTTLDGVDRALDPEMLVIADAARPVGLAGVMGGADSEVTAATVDVFLEAAHFDRQAVRLTAKRLGLHTDASHRFERGADLEACRIATDQAAALLVELAGGRVLPGAIDVRGPERPARRGRLDLARLDVFAGATIPPADTHRWLAGLGFAPQALEEGVLAVTIPSWRYYDFEPRSGGEVFAQDLYEEVIRAFGFENVPAALPALPDPDGHPIAAVARRGKIRRHLAASGFVEAVDFAFIDPAADRAYPSLAPEAKALPLENPISKRASVMRRSLVPGLVESARFNQRRGASSVRLFEVATVFFDNPDATLPDQPEMVGLVCGGRVGNPWQHPSGSDLDLFDLKGGVESLAEEMGVRLLARPASGLPGLLAGSAAELYRPEHPTEIVGYLGRLEAEEGYPLYVAEISADALTPETIDLSIDPPSRFPGIDADLTLTHALDVPWAEIEAAIRDLAASVAPDLVSFELTVRYRGEGVPAGAVNTTIHFFYNSRQRSLTQDEVNGEQLALAAELERRFGFRG
ncbi:MAG TPA: phenylalanine--tRNA ligase subunit beta [Thermoanaerobaculia bacterium]|nr:phenylalanine--tRNA ligase subunit beta [Thermoanaerobaculia bacterium]